MNASLNFQFPLGGFCTCLVLRGHGRPLIQWQLCGDSRIADLWKGIWGKNGEIWTPPLRTFAENENL